MKTITKIEYEKIHNDYKGIFSSDERFGTNYNGKKTIMRYGDNGTTLFIENVSFKIVKTDKENINPFN